MMFDYSLAGLVTVGLMIYLVYALLQARAALKRSTTMTVIGWIQILLFCAIVAALVVPLGAYMTRVFNGERTFLSPVLRPVEAGLYWLGGVDEKPRAALDSPTRSPCCSSMSADCSSSMP